MVQSWDCFFFLFVFYLSTIRESVVQTKMSKLSNSSFASALFCTKLSNKQSFKVLYRPGGAMPNPKQ